MTPTEAQERIKEMNTAMGVAGGKWTLRGKPSARSEFNSESDSDN